MRVAVNSAIDLRGISGTARSVEMIRRSLIRLGGIEVVDVSPRHPPDRSKVRNALDQASWDFWLAARACPDAEVLVSPCNLGAARRRQGHILVVHDTMPFEVPEMFDPAYRMFFKTLVGVSVRRSDVVLVPSQYTASKIRSRWPAANVIVAGWPIRGSLAEPVRDRAGGHRRVLMVGVTEPYKNHLVGLEAVAQCRDMSGTDLKLTLVGPAGRAEPAVIAAMARLDPRQEWIERRISVSDAELALLYARSWALLQPSVLEGFGFPVAEAAALGLPVIHSGRGSLPEIIDAGVAEPDEPANYALRLRALMDDGAYQAESARHVEVRERLSEDAFDAKVRRALLEATSRT
jgi:glycosyltransferase involved in cell wall biosynthesis